MTEDIRKLLGGYATGTLTDEEQKALYEAALHDSALFGALADEHALRELLEDSAARSELLRATETPRFTFTGILREWFDRPKAKVLVGVGAAVLIAIGIREISEPRGTTSPQPDVVATVRAPSRAVPVGPAPESQQPTQAANVEQPRITARAKRTSVPAVAALNAPPEPVEVKAVPTPDTFTRVANAGDLEMKYAVLLRNGSGDYLPISPDYEFVITDRVRLRVEVNHNGMLAVTEGGGKPVHVLNVTAGSPVVLPQDLRFESGSQSVELSFVPVKPEPVAMALQSQQAEESPAPRRSTSSLAQSKQADGVVSQLRQEPSPVPGLKVEFTLHRKDR